MTVRLYQRPLSAVLNIFSNMAGGVWIALLTLVITPIQVNILGMESYGLVGFIVTLQAICSAFDFGLSATLTRELAMSDSHGALEEQALVQTVGIVYWGLAVVLGGILLWVAEPLSQLWFKPKDLDPQTLVLGVQIIAVYLALRWPVAFYSSILSGLQRMDWLNLLKVTTTSLRLIGSIVVLLIYRDLIAFLGWVFINAWVEVLAYFLVCRKVYAQQSGLRQGEIERAEGVYKQCMIHDKRACNTAENSSVKSIHPLRKWRLMLSWPVLQPLWPYALKMNMMAILTVLVVQADRLQVSRLLSMEALGYYSLAYSTVSSVSLILGAISSALLPSFSSTHSKENLDILVGRYYQFSRMTLFITGGLIFALLFFGELILSIWVSPTAAAGAWEPLAWLAVGFWFSAACSNAYTISVSCGRPDIPLKVSLLSAFPYLLLLPFFIQGFAVNGAAIAFLGLNIFYIVTLVPQIHSQVLKISSIHWFAGVFLPFSALGIFSFGLLKWLLVQELLPFKIGSDFLALTLASLLYGIAGLILLGQDIRRALSRLMYDKLRFLGRRELS